MHDESMSLPPATDFSRRGFVMTSLAAGFALSVQPVTAQTIATDTTGLLAGEVKVPVSDGEIPAYRALPEKGGPFPVILVVQEIFGVHEHIKDICRRLAKLGYLAIAPELYARQGDVSKITDFREIISKVVSKVPDKQVMADLDATVAWAKGTGKADVAKLGDYRVLLGRPNRLALLRSQSRPEGRRRLVRPAGGKTHRTATEIPDRCGEFDQGPRPRPLWRSRQRDSGGLGREDAGRPQGSGQDRRDRPVSRYTARLLRRLSAQLPQGAGRGRLEAHDRLVQEVRRCVSGGTSSEDLKRASGQDRYH